MIEFVFKSGVFEFLNLIILEKEFISKKKYICFSLSFFFYFKKGDGEKTSASIRKN